MPLFWRKFSSIFAIIFPKSSSHFANVLHFPAITFTKISKNQAFSILKNFYKKIANPCLKVLEAIFASTGEIFSLKSTKSGRKSVFQNSEKYFKECIKTGILRELRINWPVNSLQSAKNLQQACPKTDDFRFCMNRKK
jgi:hypothetical protein